MPSHYGSEWEQIAAYYGPELADQIAGPRPQAGGIGGMMGQLSNMGGNFMDTVRPHFENPGAMGTMTALGNMALSDMSTSEGALGSIGGTVGGIAGQAIPVPVLGPIAGSAVGQGVGRVVGGFFGDDEEEEQRKKAERERRLMNLASLMQGAGGGLAQGNQAMHQNLMRAVGA